MDNEARRDIASVRLHSTSFLGSPPMVTLPLRTIELLIARCFKLREFSYLPHAPVPEQIVQALNHHYSCISQEDLAKPRPVFEFHWGYLVLEHTPPSNEMGEMIEVTVYPFQTIHDTDLMIPVAELLQDEIEAFILRDSDQFSSIFAPAYQEVGEQLVEFGVGEANLCSCAGIRFWVDAESADDQWTWIGMKLSRLVYRLGPIIETCMSNLDNNEIWENHVLRCDRHMDSGGERAV
jgi:hypothetical protein